MPPDSRSHRWRTGQGNLGDLWIVLWRKQKADLLTPTRPDDDFASLAQARGIRQESLHRAEVEHHHDYAQRSAIMRHGRRAEDGLIPSPGQVGKAKVCHMPTVHKTRVHREVFTQIRLFGRRDHLAFCIRDRDDQKILGTALGVQQDACGSGAKCQVGNFVVRTLFQVLAQPRPTGHQAHPLVLLADVGQQHGLPISGGHGETRMNLVNQHMACEHIRRPDQHAGGEDHQHTNENRQLQPDRWTESPLHTASPPTFEEL